MRKSFCLLSIFLVVLHQVTAILGAGNGRDLVLTPEQAQQMSGKRLFYQEQPTSAVERTWEHTLKHVTYVTLFTDAAMGEAAGNLSQLHDYHDFLKTPFAPADVRAQSSPSRFGDIVTLASGRLDQVSSNGSYRFVEGSTDPHQKSERGVHTRALWRVQRIRHRDGDTQTISHHRYHYEMKFSVSPLTSNIGWPPHNFIQKDSDYPQSFGRVAYEEKRDQTFAERRQDRQPQDTFVRSIFQPPPPSPQPIAPLTNLNIGEYLKGVSSENSKGSSDIELFPALYNLGLRPNFIPATTFRPSYQIQFGPHPELETPLQRFPLSNELNGGHSGDAGSVPKTPVTHHFHHHFYMAPGGLNVANYQPKLGYGSTAYVPELTIRTPSTSLPPHRHRHQNLHQQVHEQQHENEQEQHQHDLKQHGEVLYSTSHALGLVESLKTGEDLHHSQGQHPFVRSPHLYSASNQPSKYQTSKQPPLLIYAGSGAEGGEDHKAFIHSEPLQETVYRYSEPDPLYVHQNSVDVMHLGNAHNYNSGNPHQQPNYDAIQETTSEKIGQVEEEQEEKQREQRPAGSQKQTKVASTKGTVVEPTSTVTTIMEESTLFTASAVPNPTVASPSKASIVSTSTAITPLRALNRFRTTSSITAGRSTTTTTTTTESPSFSKWKQRRKENVTGLDSKAKSSQRHNPKVAFMSTPPTITTTTTTMSSTTTPSPKDTSNIRKDLNFTAATAAIPIATGQLSVKARGVIEVLTQKSVSKSVSIKVGENGEEIPIIVDDDENEVKHS